LHGPENKKLAIFWTRIKCTDWAVRGKADGPTRHDRLGWLAYVQRRTVWVNKLQASILISRCKVIIYVLVAFSVAAGLLRGLLRLAVGYAHQFLIKNPIADEGFLGMEVFVEGLPDNRVSIAADTDLLKHGIDVGLELVLATLSHDNHNGPTVLDVEADVLELLRGEG